jgi:Transposase DDE domain
MAQLRRPNVTENNLQGFKYFKILRPLLERLHAAGTQRDRAGNRTLFFDNYGALLLLYFFNPVLTSLRGIQKASTLEKVQQQLGCQRTSLGSLSEASRIFDAELLQAIISELAAQALPLYQGHDAEALQGLTAVDGSLLPALPKMAWALWVDDTHRAGKLHLHFDVLKGVPCAASVTAGNSSENDQLRAKLKADRLYVIDRGYAEYRLFQDIVDAQSSFIGRIRDNAVFEVVEERPVSAEARTAGVLSDRVVWLGGVKSGAVLRQKLRLVEVDTGKLDSHGNPEVLRLVSDRLELDATLIALAYRFRWTVELFFRWFKCILGCKHLLSTCQNGVTIQVYLALIASLLIRLWTGHKPTKRTFEMLCFYFMGLASDEELQAHLAELEKKERGQGSTTK